MPDNNYNDAIELLKGLISLPSFSKEEAATANLIDNFLASQGVTARRHLNNVWATNHFFDSSKPTILLNSHHDTVRPNKGYTLDPFSAQVKEEKLFGLGSNDAGGALVSLIACFLHFYTKENLSYNIILAATAEEEITGRNGIEALLPLLPPIDFGIVGEPTLLQMAVAERGLMVVDAVCEGIAGHAARNEGENALYKAIQDVDWIRTYAFEKISPLLGPVKMTVTSIETDNKTHNIVPSECRYLVDVRINELYSHAEVFETMQKHLQAQLQMRSDRLRSTMIPLQHDLVKAGLQLGLSYYGSPTSSDKALMPFPTLKIGPGDSARSHTANEFIYLKEIREGIDLYVQLLNRLMT